MTFQKQLQPRTIAAVFAISGVALFDSGCATSSTRQAGEAPPETPPPPQAQPAKRTQNAKSPENASIHWSDEWTPLFDGESLKNWAVTDFAGHGAVHIQDHQLRMDMGEIMTGVNWTNTPLPTSNYEISLDAIKTDGSDFFCGLTFPVGTNFCSLIVGGWGGGLVGLSSLDGADASENETTKQLYFDVNKWYHIRLEVKLDRIRAWIDKEKVVDVSIANKEVSLRPGPIYLSKPFGIAAYETAAGVRDFKLRTIP